MVLKTINKPQTNRGNFIFISFIPIEEVWSDYNGTRFIDRHKIKRFNVLDITFTSTRGHKKLTWG